MREEVLGQLFHTNFKELLLWIESLDTDMNGQVSTSLLPQGEIWLRGAGLRLALYRKVQGEPIGAAAL